MRSLLFNLPNYYDGGNNKVEEFDFSAKFLHGKRSSADMGIFASNPDAA